MQSSDGYTLITTTSAYGDIFQSLVYFPSIHCSLVTKDVVMLDNHALFMNEGFSYRIFSW